MKEPTPKAANREEDLKQRLAHLRGSLQGKLSDKPFSEWWAEYKKEEKDLEEGKLARMPSGKMSPVRPLRKARRS